MQALASCSANSVHGHLLTAALSAERERDRMRLPISSLSSYLSSERSRRREGRGGGVQPGGAHTEPVLATHASQLAQCSELVRVRASARHEQLLYTLTLL